MRLIAFAISNYAGTNSVLILVAHTMHEYFLWETATPTNVHQYKSTKSLPNRIRSMFYLIENLFDAYNVLRCQSIRKLLQNMD